MKVYLVGGAVRDKLLGRVPREFDWVVVGATADVMRELGYEQVGRDFPVFLHPETKQEYALARTERKRGHGHQGFSVHFDESVTLEEDLRRRDLTVNAMAMDDADNLIDPYGGQADLENRVLRHVSDAFVEDPLRVLRTARFAARYAHRSFVVAPETVALMRRIVSSGELAHLSSERIWSEIDTALQENSPHTFVRVLRDCGALAALLPEVDALFGVPQPEAHHPEIDTGEHVLLALQESARLLAPAAARFAVLVHDVGKALTPRAEWPRHIGHEERGAELVENLCERLRPPVRYRQLALAVCRYHLLCHRALELRGATLLKLIEAVDGLRRPERFEAFLVACEADARGRSGLENRDYPQADYLRAALDCIGKITAEPFLRDGLEGRALGEAIQSARINALEALRPAP